MNIPMWAKSQWIWIVTVVCLGLVVWFTGFDLTFLWSPKDYWYALVSAVIGALIGIRWTISQFAGAEAKQRRNCVLRLRDCLQFNIDRLNQARQMIQNQQMIPNFPLDTAQLNHWLSQSYDRLDHDLLRDLDWQRYQLDHITVKIVSIGHLITSIGTRPMTPADLEYLAALRGDLVRQIDGVLGALPALIDRLPN